MEDSWLEKEEFNFDIPLSPLHDGESKDCPNDDEEEEVFFGPVGVMERCAAAVVEKDDIKPMQPLDAKQRAILLKESAALSVLLRHKPLSNVQNASPIAVVHPMVKKAPAQTINISQTIQPTLAETNKENSIPSEEVKQTTLNSVPKRLSESIHKRSQSVPKNLDKMMKSSPKTLNSSSNDQMKLNVSAGTEKVKPRGIPRLMAESKSKIARPTNIPSFKQGLLTTQPKLRGSTNQESKLKPMKVVHSQLKNPAAIKTEKLKSDTNSCNVSSISSKSSISTPLSKENKRVRSSTGEIPKRRSSVGLSSSKLAFPKPNNNSTPMRTNSTSRLTKTGPSNVPTRNSANKTNITPRRSISDLSFPSSRDRSTPLSNRPVARKSLLSRQLQNDHSPNISTTTETRQAAKRKSITSYNSSLISDADSPTKGSNNLTRSGTFILDESAKIISSSNHVLIDEEMKFDAFSNCESNDKDSQDKPSCETQEDTQAILIPEIAMKHQSPLLKFDSPVAKDSVVDPFAIGGTPPSNNLPLLSPEQVQKDLIEW